MRAAHDATRAEPARRTRPLTSVFGPFFFELNCDGAGALDWGWNGLVVYGCQAVVVLADPDSLQVLQTFHLHTAPVVCVRWYANSSTRPDMRRR